MRPSADLLLCNANVLTLDPAKPRAAAVAIRGDRILLVGGDDDIQPLKGPHTRVIDCHGKAVIPGFEDAHCHPLALAASLLSVDCGPLSVRSIGDLISRIHERASSTPAGEWIRATGYHEFYLREKRHPNRWELDQATSDHPVKLSHRSGHACVLNSLGLERLGISSETPEPPGSIIERDLATGEPNGILFEMNSYVESRMPPLTDQEMDRGMALANQLLLSHGITSIQDASWANSQQRLRLLGHFRQEGTCFPRVSMMIGTDDLQEFASTGLTTGSNLGNGVRLGAVKMVLQTATGHLSPSQEDLDWLVSTAHQAGFQLAIHAVEQNEVEAAVNALEYALSQAPRTGHRHRLEHCSVCPPRLVRRLAGIQAVIVTQPGFIYYSGERYLATVPASDLEWLYPIGSLTREGLVVAAGSDAPVSPPSPLVGIEAAVTRTAETGQVVLEREAVGRVEALKMYTWNAAYASFEEREKGRIAAGNLADLVVLSADPTQVPSKEIESTEVLMTIIGGEVAWQR